MKKKTQTLCEKIIPWYEKIGVFKHIQELNKCRNHHGLTREFIYKKNYKEAIKQIDSDLEVLGSDREILLSIKENLEQEMLEKENE